MEMERDSFVIIFLILLCALGMGSSEGKRRTTKTLFPDEGCGRTQEINQDMAEQTYIYCRKYLIGKKDAIKDFDLHIPQEETIDLKSALLTRRKFNDAVNLFPPHLKEALFGCLRKKGLALHALASETIFEQLFINCVELTFSLSNFPRRYLIGKSSQKLAPGPSSALVASRATELAPVPGTHSHAPAPSYPAPTNYLSLRMHSPRMALDDSFLANLASGDTEHFYSSPPPPAHKHSPHRSHGGKQQPSNQQDDIARETIIAVVATAAITFSLVALLFCCCIRGSSNRIGPRDGQKDEKPLLNLSDFSAGSSQKSISLGSSSNKEFSINSGKNASLLMKNDNYDNSLSEASSSETTAGAPYPPLKPPPGRSTPPPPGPPPPPPPKPRPPPPPKAGRPPPMPPKASPLGPNRRRHSSSGDGAEVDGDSGSTKAKLKPFFWDKVLASPGHSMVWHEISAGSFQFNEEMIESLFGYNAVDNNRNDRKKDSSSQPAPQYIQIIDPRKAQNLSILLRALNVTIEEVVDALREGNELPAELLQTLLKMAPTTEEELKLRLFAGNISQLGPAERFLKVLVDIPFAFKRIDSLLFMSSLQEEVTGIKESFQTLEVACKKLRSSRLFLKLLEAVLKTGNRMNDGTYRGGAQAFRLDTLLKLSDVKGTDGKTTLLHFVVQEIIRSEGVRAVRTARSSQSISTINSEDFVEDPNKDSEEHYRNLGLQVVSGLSGELEDVKKAAVVDADSLTSTLSKLNHSLTRTKEFLNSEMKSMEEGSEFYCAMSNFADRADADIAWLLEEEKRIMALVKSTADYFHGHSGKDEGLRLFAIVRDFLIMLDKTCREVRDTRKPIKTSRKEAASVSASPENAQPSSSENHQPSPDIRQRLFPAIRDRRMDSSSSDDDSS